MFNNFTNINQKNKKQKKTIMSHLNLINIKKDHDM